MKFLCSLIHHTKIIFKRQWVDYDWQLGNWESSSHALYYLYWFNLISLGCVRWSGMDRIGGSLISLISMVAWGVTQHEGHWEGCWVTRSSGPTWELKHSGSSPTPCARCLLCNVLDRLCLDLPLRAPATSQGEGFFLLPAPAFFGVRSFPVPLSHMLLMSCLLSTTPRPWVTCSQDRWHNLLKEKSVKNK